MDHTERSISSREFKVLLLQMYLLKISSNGDTRAEKSVKISGGGGGGGGGGSREGGSGK